MEQVRDLGLKVDALASEGAGTSKGSTPPNKEVLLLLIFISGIIVFIIFSHLKNLNRSATYR